MKKIVSLVIALFSCMSQIAFASKPKNQDKVDVFVYPPVTIKDLQTNLANMPAIKIPCKKKVVEKPFTEEAFFDESDDRITSNANQFKALVLSDIQSFKDMIAVEKYMHDFKKDHNPDAPRSFFRPSLVQARTKKAFPEDELWSPLETSTSLACSLDSCPTQEEIDNTVKYFKFMQFFINEGADVNYKEGRLIHKLCKDFQYKIRYGYFNYKTYMNIIDAIDILIQAQVNCNQICESQTPLHTLIESIPHQNNTTSGLRRFQRYAGLETQARLISKFLSAGANPYLRNGNGQTVFEVAKTSANETENDYFEKYLHEIVAQLPNIPQLKRQAFKTHAQLIKDENRQILLTNVHSKIQTKHAKSLQKQGRLNELQAYVADCQEQEENMPKDLRLARAQELSRESHAILERSGKA